MGIVEQTIELPAPPERVWDLVTDLSRYGDWVSIHKGFPEPPPEQVAEGATFKQELALVGQTVTITWTAKKVDEGRLVEWEGKGPMGSKAFTAYRLEPSGEGTTFHYSNEFKAPGGPLGKLANGPVDAISGKEAKASLENLKGLF